MSKKVYPQASLSELWFLSYPLIVTMASQVVMQFVDRMFLAWYSHEALAACVPAGVLAMTFSAMFMGLASYTSVFISQFYAQKKYASVTISLWQGIFLAVLSACLLASLTPLGGALIRWFDHGPAVTPLELKYFGILNLFGGFAVINNALASFFSGRGKTKVPMYVAVCGNIVNIVLDYVMIFGKLGFPEMGIAGAALASNLSEIIAVSFLSIYLFKRVDIVKYGLNKLTFINLKLLKRILNISVWTMLQQFISVSTWFLFFIAIEHLGERELAVSNVVRSLSSFPYVIISALAAAVSSITGNLIGKGCSAEVLPAISRATQLCGIIIFPLLILMALAAYPLLRIYTDNQALIQASIPAYLVMLSAFIPLTPAWILFNAVSGTGNTRYAMKIEFYSMFVYVFHIFVVILYFKLPLAICWTADWVYNVSILIMAYRYMHSNKWQHKKI